VECSAQGASRGAVKPSFHLLACSEHGMKCFGEADRGPGFGIASKARRQGFYGKCSEPAHFHSITPDQCGFDLVEDGIDRLFDVLGEKQLALRREVPTLI
jgi:hypothetical protein